MGKVNGELLKTDCGGCGVEFLTGPRLNPARLIPTVDGTLVAICPRCADAAKTPRSYFPGMARPSDFGPADAAFLRALGISADACGRFGVDGDGVQAATTAAWGAA